MKYLPTFGQARSEELVRPVNVSFSSNVFVLIMRMINKFLFDAALPCHRR